MIWVGLVEHIGEMINAYMVVEKQKGRNRLGDLGIDGKIILKQMLRNSV
jgi:hypothetical protein